MNALAQKKTLEFALRAFLYTIQRPAKKKDIESTIGKSLDQIDLIDARNYLLSREINTKVKADIYKYKIKPSLVPAIFTDGNVAQLITKDSNGKLIEVDKAGKRPIVTNKISGTLMYISEVDINPTTNLLDLLLSRRKKLILALYVISLIIAGTNLILPIVIRSYYLIIIPAKAFTAGIMILILGIIVAKCDSVIKQLRSKLLMKSRANIETILTSAITKRFISLESNEITTLGNIGLKTYYRKAEQVSDYIHGTFAKAALDAPFTIIYLFVIYLFAGPVVIVPLVSMLGAISVVLVMSNMNFRLRTVETKTGLGLSGIEKEIVQKKDRIQLASMEWLWMQRLRGLSAESVSNKTSIDSQNNQLKTLSETITQVTGILTLVVGSVVALQTGNANALGNLMATMFILWRIFTPFQFLMQAILQWQFIKKQFVDLEAFIKRSLAMGTKQKINRHRRLNGNIELIGCASQSRLTNETTFFNTSFSVEKGTINVITGDDEVAKNNILESIAQLNKLRTGTMLFDGVDSRQYSEEEIQESIAFVGEKPALFTGSLYDNLKLMDSYASKEKVSEVLNNLGIFDDPYIANLTLDSILTSDYINRLPNGTKRMLSMAQGLIKNSPIILIEQMGRGLNPNQYEALTRYLQNEKTKSDISRKTIVYSTTNQRLVDYADRLIVVKDKSVVFQGSPSELAQKLSNISR